MFFQEKEVKLLAVQVSCVLDTKDRQVVFQMPSPMEKLHQKLPWSSWQVMLV